MLAQRSHGQYSELWLLQYRQLFCRYQYQKVIKLSDANSFCAKELWVENVLLNTLNLPILEDKNMLPSRNSKSRATYTYWKKDASW